MVACFQFQAVDIEPCFFSNFTTQRGHFILAPARYSAGKGKTPSVIATDNQDLRPFANDSNRSPQRSENRNSSIEREAGARNQPEKTALKILRKGAQARSLARDPENSNEME